LLTNVIYIGEVNHKGTIYPGEHEGIISSKVLKRACQLLNLRKWGPEAAERKAQGSLLEGLLECAVCRNRMVPGYTHRNGRKHPYYVCFTAQKRGAQACPRQSVMASKIEPVVITTLYELAGDPVREHLRSLLQVNQADWDRTAVLEQRRILAGAFDVIRYDHREKRVTLRLAPSVHSDGTSEEISTSLRERLFEAPDAPAPTVSLRGPRTPSRLSSVARLLALAHRLDGLVRDGTVANYAELARYASVTRARVSQIMNLLNLAPQIQEELLFLSSSDAIHITERTLQRLASEPDWARQAELFRVP
jgi:hypothetical protein